MSDGAFTKAMLDEAILSTYRAGPQSRVMIISDHAKQVLDLTLEAHDNGWDRRRLKREIRRIGKVSYRRPYHKRSPA